MKGQTGIYQQDEKQVQKCNPAKSKEEIGAPVIMKFGQKFEHSNHFATKMRAFSNTFIFARVNYQHIYAL
jgi:hypothetical protein